MAKINKIGQIALKDEKVSTAIVAQSIIDEGAIGADGTINVTYTSKKMPFIYGK